MRKTIFILAVALFIEGCSGLSFFGGESTYDKLCPNVQISRNNAYLSQIVGSKDNFQISLIGYEGFCFYNSNINQERATIKPLFKVRRLRPSQDTHVDFAYYTETIKGPPEFLGKKTYYEGVDIPQDSQEVEYKGNPVEVAVPLELKYEFSIILGLVLSPNEKAYNQKTFDIKYKYQDR